MPSGIKTLIEKNITKITYPSGTITYVVNFEGKVPFYEKTPSLTKARELKAAHLKKHPELVAMDPEAKRLRNIERAATTKVPGEKFINEFVTRPGTYSIRIGRSKKFGDLKKTWISDTVVGLASAKKREKELITQMEKLTGRGIDVLEPKPVNPNYAKAVAEVRTQMTKYNKLGYYPDDILVKISEKYKLPYVKGEGANRQLVNLVQDAKLIDRTKLTALAPKYLGVVEKWKKYKGDKTKVGVRRSRASI